MAIQDGTRLNKIWRDERSTGLTIVIYGNIGRHLYLTGFSGCLI